MVGRLSAVSVVCAAVLGAGACQWEGVRPTAREDRLFAETQTDLAFFERSHGRVFDGARVPLHYLEWRAPDGVPFVFLHRTYGTAFDLAPFADAFLEAGLRPVALDWYGHGGTPLPGPEVTLAEQVDDLRAFLDALEIDKAIVAGHSRGGVIATAFYERYPERVRALVLIDGGSASPGLWFQTLDDAALAGVLAGWADPPAGASSLPIFASEEAAFLEGMSQVSPPVSVADRFRIQARIRRRDEDEWTSWNPTVLRWLEQDTWGGFVNGVRDPASGPPFLRDCSNQRPQEIYSKLNVPMLVLDPTGDALDLTAQNRALMSRHPALVEHIVYENTGHDLPGTRPKRFVADVSAFVERVLEP